MQLAERVQVRKTPALSLLCHRTKNLHNLANFYVRQELFHLESVLTYYDLDFMLHGSHAYQALPAQTAQQVLRQVAGEWRAFFAACKAYRNDPRKFLGAPRPPRYKPRGGENIAVFTNQQCRIKGGWLHFPAKADLPPIRTRVQIFQQVRVVPKGSYYVIEIVYNVEAIDLGLDKQRALGVDLGVVNLVTAASNTGILPFAIKGGAAKSVNQFYNKRLAQLRSVAARANNTRNTRRIARFNWIRANKILDIFHKVSRTIVKFCIQNNIGTIAVGYNPRWKQSCRLGRQVNQSFINLPFLSLVEQIQYKAELHGITVILVDERYTSRCSALDLEVIGWHARYAGRRVRRGLFQAHSSILINADVNAAYNILRQAVPEAFADGIEGVGLHPVLVGIA